MTDPRHRWFSDARFGLFIHWGPYAQYGRGEQVLFREHLDQNEYAQAACAWNPSAFDARAWAKTAVDAGMRYAVFTTRHHDGFCLWNTRTTDYSTAAQAAKRDFVAEYVNAFREAGLRVGLYYSLADWRIPAYWSDASDNPRGWDEFRDYVHAQIRELLTSYGKIDVLWFDGAWPHNAIRWQSEAIIEMAQSLQPGIMINNRLDCVSPYEPSPFEMEAAGDSAVLGDFGTPEHEIVAESSRQWESCQVSTWRLWGHAIGERWRPADFLLDMLVEASVKGGNLLLNVGPDADGRFPQPFVERCNTIGQWLRIHGEAIYGTEPGDVCEFVTRGRQTRKGNNLYLVIRFWDRRPTLRLAGLATPVLRASLLTTGKELRIEQNADELLIHDLPANPPTELFPVIQLECASPPQPQPWAKDRLWSGDPKRMIQWAQSRGESVWADGQAPKTG